MVCTNDREFVCCKKLAIDSLVSGADGISGFVSSTQISGLHSAKKKVISTDCSTLSVTCGL